MIELAEDYGVLPAREARGTRRMPNLYGIATYWATRPEVFEVDLDAPHCFRCDIVAALDETKSRAVLWHSAGRYLDRAHLTDRQFDGLDGPQNLVPLCKPCHRAMPLFREADAAIRWCWAEWRYEDWETRPVPPRHPRIVLRPEPEPVPDPEPEPEPLLVDTKGRPLLF